MHHDEKYFRQKFNECAKYLDAKPTSLVSLKYREVSDYQYYTQLLERLRNIKGIEVKELGNTLNGRGYLISYAKQRIVFVEHETGLEILYIAGSVASLISLVLSIGANRRDRGPAPPLFEHVEVRYFDDTDKLIEEHQHNYLPYEAFLLPQADDAEIKQLKNRISALEKKIDKLARVQSKKKKK